MPNIRRFLPTADPRYLVLSNPEVQEFIQIISPHKIGKDQLWFLAAMDFTASLAMRYMNTSIDDLAATTTAALATKAPLTGEGTSGTWPISITGSAGPAAWADITGKPSTFPPSAHTHPASDIVSGTFDDARIAASNVTQHQTALSVGWSQLTSVPAFASRWPTWTEVTDKPTTFTPSAHTHAWADITSGKPTTLGGYGITDAVNKAGDTMTGGLGLPAAGWSTRNASSVYSFSDDFLGWGLYHTNLPSPPAVPAPVFTLTGTQLSFNNTPKVGTDNVWHAGNFNPATKADTGGANATGTWPISITGSSASANSVAWTSITGKPATFPPSAHTHPISDITNLQTSLDGKANLASPTFTGGGNPSTPAGYAVTASGGYGGGYRMIDGAVQTSIWTQNDGSIRFGVGNSTSIAEVARFTATNATFAGTVQAPMFEARGNGKYFRVYDDNLTQPNLELGAGYNNATDRNAWIANRHADGFIELFAANGAHTFRVGTGGITYNTQQVWHAGNFNPATKLDSRPSLGTTGHMESNWNNAIENGWYMYPNGLNEPVPSNWYIGRTTTHNSDWITQEVWRFTEGTAGVTTPIYRRSKMGGTWGQWSPNIYTNGHIQAGSRFYIRGGTDWSEPVGSGPNFFAYYLTNVYDGATLGAYDYTTAVYKPMRIEVSALSVNPGATVRFEVNNDNNGAVVAHGRAVFRHTGASAGAWHHNSLDNVDWFIGLETDNSWGAYNTTNSWCWHIDRKGVMYVQNANSGTRTRQPRIFVQSSDPGAAAADGDLWFW